MKVCTASEMRSVDGSAFAKYGIPSLLLMENAAHKALAVLREASGGELADKKIVIFAGVGNNGGDGFALARLILTDEGMSPTIALVFDPKGLSGDALTNYHICRELGCVFVEGYKLSIASITKMIDESDVVVDAIFGTGLAREIAPPVVEVLEAINGRPATTMCLAIDIPSGVDADTGAILGGGVRADATVSFGTAKYGHFLYPGAALRGELFVENISLPAPLLDDRAADHVIDVLRARTQLPPERGDNDYKNLFGHLYILAGSRGKGGAAILAGTAALKAGAGLVTIGLPNSIYDGMIPSFVDLMGDPLDEEEGFVSERSFDHVVASLAGMDALVIGPGLGIGDGISKLIGKLIAAFDRPILLDADGLNALATDPGILKSHKGKIVLTPHLGEFARLTNLPKDALSKDLLGAVRTFAKVHDVYLVLKGHYTIVADPDGRVGFNTTGNPGMAVAGMGDVLSGVIGALLAHRSVETTDATELGVYLHGLAGDIASEDKEFESMVASDVVASVSSAFEIVRRGA